MSDVARGLAEKRKGEEKTDRVGLVMLAGEAKHPRGIVHVLENLVGGWVKSCRALPMPLAAVPDDRRCRPSPLQARWVEKERTKERTKRCPHGGV